MLDHPVTGWDHRYLAIHNTDGTSTTRLRTPEERARDQAQVTEWVRNRRDRLLEETDRAVMPDRWARMTPEQQTLWSDYRQQLRDLPQQPGWPYDHTWPTQP